MPDQPKHHPLRTLAAAAVFAGVAFAVWSAFNPPKTPPDPRMPASERAFLAAVHDGARTYRRAGNGLVRGAARRTRASALCAALPAATARGWRGTIRHINRGWRDSAGRPTVAVALRLDRRTGLETGNAVFDPPAMLTERASPVGSAAATLRKGERVVFSAVFFRHQVDCFEETSLTEEGGMSDPRFTVHLTALRAAVHP